MTASQDAIAGAAGSTRRVRPRWTGRVDWWPLVLFALGTASNVTAYGSLEPIVIACIFFFVGAVVLRFTPAGGVYERLAFRRMFAAGWLMAGVAAVYKNFLHDADQDPFVIGSDSGVFYSLASSGTRGMSLSEIAQHSVGAGAVVLWRFAYDCFDALGFEKGWYIGVLVNVLAVALTAVTGVKTARILYGDDAPRLRRFSLLFSLCGIFWLFAALHLRDGVVLLSVAILGYVWTRYLARPTSGNLLLLGTASFVAFNFFAFLRREFLFVPVAMLFAGLAAILMFDKTRGFRKIAIYIVALAGVVVAGVLYLQYAGDLSSILSGGHSRYRELGFDSSSSKSLGMTLIVNQPIPIRLVLGFGYLYVFPIPFWSGFQLNFAYPLFKSLNALFFYGFVPLVAVALSQIVWHKTARTAALMFQVFLVFGFTLAVAGTSLETRHLGPFLVPLFVLALVPDLRLRSAQTSYRTMLFAFVTCMAAVHLAWVLLKF